VKKIVLFVSFFVFFAHAASFDCTKASTTIEKRICSDANLSRLDEEMAALYKKVLTLSQKNTISKYDGASIYHYFKQKQKKWLKERNKSCSSYKGKEQKACLTSYYQAQIKKLNTFADGGLVYRNFGNVIYEDTHKPYIATWFKPYMSKEEYKEFFAEWLRWTDAYKVCKDRFDVIDDSCAQRVAKEKRQYYEKLLEKYKNNRYLIANGKCIKIQKQPFAFFDEESGMCRTFSIYKRSELQKLFDKPLEIEEISIEIPNNVKECNADSSDYYENNIETILYITDNILVLKSERSDYTGGAHGDFESDYTNLDRHTGKIITWKNLFGKKRPFYRYIVKSVRERIGFEHVEKLSDDELYDMAASTYRMQLTPKGIVIWFGLYEISGYGAGEPSFLIPLKKLKRVMSKEKFAYYFAKPIKLQNHCNTKEKNG